MDPCLENWAATADLMDHRDATVVHALSALPAIACRKNDNEDSQMESALRS